MNPFIGWALALVALVVGWRGYGWPGVAMAGSVIVFWVILQFSRSLRALRDAGRAPVGHVPSAVMFHAKLRTNLPMMKVIAMTRSLGRRVSDTPEVWAWMDDSHSEVRLTFANGRVRSWVLDRPVQADAMPGA